jgi:hypothetical protein
MGAKEFNASMLDKGIDDIDDLPGFVVPPNGMYCLKLNLTPKVVNDKDVVEASFEVVSTIEQNDADAVPPKEGTKFSTLYHLGTEIGEGKLKELLTPISAATGVKSIKQLVTETCKDFLISAKVKRRADKEDKDKFYAQISDVTVN